ncbi:phage antirepressor KilAC domain-containing protein [Corynebacterium pseudodiphtheriticum]|uniref:phage antirepressor KilAC domain-containing protein n=1 Tax=Corynebacterium pseudodiphtheriticum TaxID=37637 RepID=UPI00254C3006|nr:phage antirepressor KilAC domain-containing protein [Corynebacterium pseudodiphtheriticum]MDK8500687.1 phage antirepressor KilAC domain-containing protein [Corynebacterium pseudodiphtheriticum]MDK8775754.1 phage antirepressor KilAC domain-containing protein [Corynebacterium pseudodiphtheriticum]
MTELIPIHDEAGRKAVMGRDLHAFLEVTTAYKDWFPRMVTYGFEEGKDYVLKNEHLDLAAGMSQRKNHIISLDMAKEISMIQRTERGKQARQYFIECERQAKQMAPQLPQDYASALRELAASVEEKEKAQAELEAARPKVVFADAVATSKSEILIGELAKILRGNGIQIGQTRLFTWMRENGFLIRRKGTDWNMPTQRAMELGLFRIKETAVTHSGGHTTVNKTPKVTGTGQQYFVERFLDGRFRVGAQHTIPMA